MSLSFREQAAIAIRTMPPVDADDREWSSSEAVERAQHLADACCAKWGHDWERIDPDAQPPCGSNCLRCGAKEGAS